MFQHGTALQEPTESYTPKDVVLTKAQVRKHNRALADLLQRHGGVRIQTAYFRCPSPCTEKQYERVRKTEIDKWLRYMEQNGWILVSRVKIRRDKSRRTYDMRGNWYSIPLLDYVDIPVAAAFKKIDMKLVRTEVLVSDE